MMVTHPSLRRSFLKRAIKINNNNLGIVCFYTVEEGAKKGSSSLAASSRPISMRAWYSFRTVASALVAQSSSNI